MFFTLNVCRICQGSRIAYYLKIISKFTKVKGNLLVVFDCKLYLHTFIEHTAVDLLDINNYFQQLIIIGDNNHVNKAS